MVRMRCSADQVEGVDFEYIPAAENSRRLTETVLDAPRLATRSLPRGQWRGSERTERAGILTCVRVEARSGDGCMA